MGLQEDYEIFDLVSAVENSEGAFADYARSHALATRADTLFCTVWNYVVSFCDS